MAKPILTAARLREVLQYNPESGHFTRLIRIGSGGAAGSTAGSRNRSGYLIIPIDGVSYYAHRLAWFYMHNEWPAGDVDHMDGNRTNNRAANLRSVNRRMNLENQRVAKSHSATGILGVFMVNGSWVSQIRVKGRTKYLGAFKSPDEAQAVYIAAKRQLHEGNTL